MTIGRAAHAGDPVHRKVCRRCHAAELVLATLDRGGRCGACGGPTETTDTFDLAAGGAVPHPDTWTEVA